MMTDDERSDDVPNTPDHVPNTQDHREAHHDVEIVAEDAVVETDVTDGAVDEAVAAESRAASRRAAREARRHRRTRRANAVPPDPRAPLVFGAGVIGAAVIVGLGLLVPAAPATSVPPPLVEPVDTSVVICPEPGGADGAEVTSSVSIVPDLAGQDRPGATTITYLGRPDDPVDIITGDGIGLTEPGASVEVINDDGRLRPLVTTAEGGLAPGLVAGQFDLGLSGPRRGLATLNCPAPSPSWWFVGGGATTGRTTTMYLVNPETSEAEVDVSLAGPDGPIQVPALRGLIIPAQSRTAVRLTRVAPRVPSVAWRVQVRTGRIVASVLDIDAEGFVPRGIDWIPPSAEPSTTVYLPGVIAGDGRRRLIVHAPGETDAQVKVRIITPDGAYTPIDTPEIEVPAGAVSIVGFTDALQGSAATVELTSDQPIVASIRQTHVGVDASAADIREDISFSTGASPVTSLAAAAGLPSLRGTAVTLWLTAPARGGSSTGAGSSSTDSDDTGVTATIRLVPFGDGVVEPEPIVVDVSYDRVVPVTIPRPENALSYTAIITSTGPLYVSQTSLRRGSRGSLISGYPLGDLRTTVSIPSAGRDEGLSIQSVPTP